MALLGEVAERGWCSRRTRMSGRQPARELLANLPPSSHSLLPATGTEMGTTEKFEDQSVSTLKTKQRKAPTATLPSGTPSSAAKLQPSFGFRPSQLPSSFPIPPSAAGPLSYSLSRPYPLKPPSFSTSFCIPCTIPTAQQSFDAALSCCSLISDCSCTPVPVEFGLLSSGIQWSFELPY
ncbi:hypothetical protein CRG98_012729 [Punica granatum]|uniref:Uncharacterized protein n=1 Tax=Punica granatum TaxID=22663 RepID=A0A2I0KFA5_PUNGR|nr:hypothetical protein CRG98_012729 [Punica granatum]